MTGPAVSYYYPDLDDLLTDVYRRQIQATIERWPSSVDGLNDPWRLLQAAVFEDLPTGPEDVDAIITYQFAGEPRFARIYSALSATLHVSQIGYLRAIIDAGIATSDFTPDLESPTIARALIGLADAYGLQVVMSEPGMDQALAHSEILKVAASLLRFSDHPGMAEIHKS